MCNFLFEKKQKIQDFMDKTKIVFGTLTFSP
jgi:hypothetical protein